MADGVQKINAIEEHGGAARDETAPLLFWDGYGLDHVASGIFTYARALANELASLRLTPELICNETTAANFPDLTCHVLLSPFMAAKLLDSKLLWPLRVKQQLLRLLQEKPEKPAILHGLSNINLPVSGFGKRRIATVITVHDIIPLLAPSATSKAYYWQMKLALPRVLAVADRIVCVSEWTKRTLLDLFPAVGEKLVVVRNGLQSQPIMARKKESVSNARPRLLYIARNETYKRIPFLCSILRAARGQLSGALITDRRGLAFAHAQAADLLKSKTLEVFANLDVVALQHQFALADVYVHPSLYEGFCLPVAEALQSGLPVVYQAGSAIDELAGDKVAIAMPRGAAKADENVDDGASTRHWIEAIESAYTLSQDPQFLTLLNEHLASKPTWKDAALTLKSMYNDLSTSRF